MKAVRIILYGVLVASAFYAYMPDRVEPVAVQDLDAVAVVLVQEPVPMSLEEMPRVNEPIAQPLEVETVVAPVAEIKPQSPVQPVEERGDAMLFEISALEGMPFDQAIVMPFE